MSGTVGKGAKCLYECVRQGKEGWESGLLWIDVGDVVRGLGLRLVGEGVGPGVWRNT